MSFRGLVLVAALSMAVEDDLFAWLPGTGDPSATGSFTVDTTNRTDVLAFYNTVYPESQNYVSDIDWTGSLTSGNPGTTSLLFQQDVLRRINFYRALAGLPAAITFDNTEINDDQQAALMFSVNNQIEHLNIPTTLTFYTAAAATAAANSNLALGIYGPGAIDGYMTDDGSNNLETGHRRWLLYSESTIMGTGDVPNGFQSANALWITGNFNTAATPKFVTWPNSGFCPLPLIPLSPERWSLSYPGANFASATVTMMQGTTAIPVTIISSTDNGFGDNTIVWTPTTLPTSIPDGTTFTVTVSGIGGISGITSHTYSVTLFDPNILGQSVAITGSSTPPTIGSSYNFTSITEADAYDLQVSTQSTAAWNEGAETSPAPMVTASTTGSNTIFQSAEVHTGASAFQLMFPPDVDGSGDFQAYDFDDQSFEITRQIVPSSTSNLQFYDLCRFATTTTTLSAQVSTDNGTTWTTIWTRNGVGGSSNDWDQAFIQNDVSLAAYAGQIILVRFDLSANGTGVYLGTPAANYGFFIDDITVTNGAQLTNISDTTLGSGATSFMLNTATAGGALQAGTAYYLRIRPEVGLKWYGFGPYNLVTAAASVTGYASWVSLIYPAVTGGPDGDFSHDGIPNSLKYAFGLNPTVINAPASLPAPVLSGTTLSLSFTAPGGIVGVTYGAQWSTDLSTWTNLPDTGSGNTHTFTVTPPLGPPAFIRQKITVAP